MKGHIRERSPGHWAIILEQRDPASGKRRRKWHSFEGTKREAQIECSRLITAVTGGTYIEQNKITLSAFLSRWTDHIKSQVSPKSFERYAGIVNQNITPALGAVVLTKLKPAQISDLYAAALTNGRRDDKEGGLARHYQSRPTKTFRGLNYEDRTDLRSRRRRWGSASPNK
jgi:Phage integrase, N-terminal SAM-like domain